MTTPLALHAPRTHQLPKRAEPPLPTEARKRLSSAAHVAGLMFETKERLRLLAELRELVRSGATKDQIESYVQRAEDGTA